MLILTLSTVFLLLGVLEQANGFPFGAPMSACGTLAPNPFAHGAPPQTSPVPYEVDISALSDGNGGFEYVPGQLYQCTQG